MSLVIHEQKKPKMQPFYWVLTFEMHTLGMLLGLALAAGPLILLFLWPSVWTWISLVAIPVGIWMCVKLFINLKELVWRNTHLDEHLLYEDHVEFTIWDPESKEAVKGSLRIHDVKEMYYGRYLFQYSYAYKKNKMTEKTAMVELMPVLYLITNDGIKDRAVAVPFIDPMDANRWLEVLGRGGIPLWLSSVVIHDFRDESIPDLLREDGDLQAAAFDGNIERQYRPYMDELMKEEEDRELTDEELDQLEYEMKLYEYEVELHKRRSAFRGIGLLAWLVFPVQLGIGLWMMRLADQGSIEPEHFGYPFLLIAAASMLFFVLVKWMRWLQIVIFPVATLISFFFLGGSEIETHPTYLMSSTLLGTAMLSLPVVGLIYLLVRFLRKGRDAKKLPPVPEPYSPRSEPNQADVQSGDQLPT